MNEIVRTLSLAKSRNKRFDAPLQRLCGPLGGFAQICLEFAERHLDRIEIGRVFGQVAQLCADSFDRLSDAGNLVSWKIVHHDYISATKRGRQALLYISQEDFAVHGPFDHHRRGHFITAQAGHERQRRPGSQWHTADQSLAARTATIKTGHVGIHRGLVDEDKAGRIKKPLLPYPAPPGARHVRPLLFGGSQAFF